MTPEEAVRIGQDLIFAELEWEEAGLPYATLPCPNGKVWCDLTEEERAKYQLAIWWAKHHEWVALQIKH